MKRQRPIPVKDQTPYVLTNPIGIDVIVKGLQEHFSTELSWLEKSFNRAEIMTNIDTEEDTREFAKCWTADGQDELNMIINDNWTAYSFFVSRGSETPLEYNIGFDSQYERELSVYFWFKISELNTEGVSNYTELLKQEVLMAIRTFTPKNDQSIEVTNVEDDPTEVFSDFSIDIDSKQYLYYPYGGIRIDMNAIYRDMDICDIQLDAPTSFDMFNPTENTIDSTCVSNSGGNESGFEWFIGTDGVNFLPAGTTGTNITSFTYTGLNVDTTYFGRVRALGIINSGFSNIDSESTASTFDPEAEAWFNAMTNPTDLEKNIINRFVVEEKGASVNNFDYYKNDRFVFLQLGAVNGLISPNGVSATAFGGGMFTNGWLGNGIDAYIDLNYNPSTDGSAYTLTDAMIGSFIREIPTDNTYAMGAQSGTNERTLLRRVNSTETHHAVNRNFFASSTPFASNQVNNIVRIPAGQEIVYKDGLNADSQAMPAVGIPNSNVYLGALSISDSAFVFSDVHLYTAMCGAGENFDQAAHNENIRIAVASFIDGSLVTDLATANMIINASL